MIERLATPSVLPMRRRMLRGVLGVAVALSLGSCASGPASLAVPINGQMEGRVEPWAGPVQEIRLASPRVYYRVHGGGAARVGAWITPTLPRDRVTARRTLALPPLNTAEFYARVDVPVGTRMRTGRAAPAFGQPGGGEQAELMDIISAESFSASMPMPE